VAQRRQAVTAVAVADRQWPHLVATLTPVPQT
jgi:hypothetical protein